MLETALRAQLPLIATHTRDLVNFEAVLGWLAERKPYRIDIEAWDVKDVSRRITEGAVLWTTEELKKLETLYDSLVDMEATLVLVNPERVPDEAFDAGEAPVPAEFVQSELERHGVETEVVEAILPGLTGLTMKEAAETVALAEALTGTLDLDSVTQARGQAFTQVRGLRLVDTRLPHYQEDPQIEGYLQWAAPFFRYDGDPRLRPRGLLLYGIRGTGKTLAAKHIARALGVPLLRLDLGAIRGKYVGETEGALRRAIHQAEREAPVVLLLDEIEKGLSGRDDGNVSQNILEGLLWWQAEHRAHVLTIMTTNNLQALPPELYRRGRIDAEIRPRMLVSEKQALVFSQELLDTYLPAGPTGRGTKALGKTVAARVRAMWEEGENQLAQADVADEVQHQVRHWLLQKGKV